MLGLTASTKPATTLKSWSVSPVQKPDLLLICDNLQTKHQNTPVDNHSSIRTINSIGKLDVWCPEEHIPATKNRSLQHLKIDLQPTKDKRTQKNRT
jgi:hypothetical protein